MKIYLDCDGVVYDIHSAIKKRNPAYMPEKISTYSMLPETYGIPRSEVFQYMKELETFKLEQPFKGAKEGIRQLKQLGEVIGYTTVPEDILEYRKYQYRKVGVSKVLVFHGDKPFMPDADVIIEDCPGVLDLYDPDKTLRIKAVRSYNKSYMGAYEVKNLMEAVGVIRKQYRK